MQNAVEVAQCIAALCQILADYASLHYQGKKVGWLHINTSTIHSLSEMLISTSALT